MRVSWFVALRFMWEQRAQNALIITGVGVGVAVLVFISALITGLQASLIERTTGSQPHVIVTPLEREGRPVLPEEPGTTTLRRIERPAARLESLPEWRKIERNLASVPGITATVPIAAGPALAVRGSSERSVAVLGADAERMDRVVPIQKNVVAGSYSVNGADVVLGVDLARDLGLGVGDRLRLTTARGDGQIFVVRGLVDMGAKGLNETWALMSLRNAQTLLGLGGAATAIYARMDELYAAEAASDRIEAITGLTSQSWMEANVQLLTALRTQTASTTMIRFFVLVTVAIGIASVLVVSVIQREREIGILRAMGFTRTGVLQVFLVQGALIGLLGSAVGSALGTLLASVFQLAAKNPDGSALFPIAMSPGLFAASAGIALFAGTVAAVLPARRAARLDPSEAIRHG